ncbi:hypothetical protein LEP1GSC089_2206 [Leptospira interrogans serovar Autumnalis str. LP101]|uniref:Uncharacterized protein n=1 Tax=Leptospira interrogans str. UI 12758 TaxID=1049938 RepID=A0A0E2D5Y4_LEPIR|nr:hypothetical protein LEP1GSC105_0964 [Leptospira interrogans str. UI 12758]EMN52542.1 hypothetical protein LEP1GSC089_2206 [Leptospira interrogans serovar Autumnalis str. LP101]
MVSAIGIFAHSIKALIDPRATIFWRFGAFAIAAIFVFLFFISSLFFEFQI